MSHEYGQDAPATRHLGQSEVQHLRTTSLGGKDIRWLDVSVHDAFRVRCVQSLGNPDRQIQQLLRLERTSVNPVLERLAVQKLTGNEGLAFVLINLLYGANAGMVQRRGGARFTVEVLQCLAVSGELLR